jgi:hypothetical protein
MVWTGFGVGPPRSVCALSCQFSRRTRVTGAAFMKDISHHDVMHVRSTSSHDERDEQRRRFLRLDEPRLVRGRWFDGLSLRGPFCGHCARAGRALGAARTEHGGPDRPQARHRARAGRCIHAKRFSSLNTGAARTSTHAEFIRVCSRVRSSALTMLVASLVDHLMSSGWVLGCVCMQRMLPQFGVVRECMWTRGNAPGV